MRSFILFLKKTGLQKIVAVFIAGVLIITAGVYVFSQPKVLKSGYQEKFDQGKYAESIPEIEKWLNSNPKDVNAMELLAALYIQKADAEPSQANKYLNQALVTLGDIVKIDPKRDESYRLIGTVYLYKNDLVNSEKNFKKAISVSGDKNLNARAGLAMIFENNGKWNEASAGYKYVLSKDPKNEIANLGLARYFISKNVSNKATEYAKIVLANSKNNASIGEAYSILGSSMTVLRQPRTASSYYKESLKYRPGNVHTLVLLGESLISSYPLNKKEDRPKALQEIIDTVNKAVELKPDYVHAYTLLYKVDLIQNKYPEANIVGKKIVALLPKDTTLTDVQKKEYADFYGGELTSVTVKNTKSVELKSDVDKKPTVPTSSKGKTTTPTTKK